MPMCKVRKDKYYSPKTSPTRASRWSRLSHWGMQIVVLQLFMAVPQPWTMPKWANGLALLSKFRDVFALLKRCRCFSLFVAVASHSKRPQPCTMPTISKVCSLSTKNFRLICAKQRINHALRRECLVRICVRVSVGKCILSWINFAGAHLNSIDLL